MYKKEKSVFDDMKLGTVVRLVSSKGKKKQQKYLSPKYANGVTSQVFPTCMEDAKDWFYCGSGIHQDIRLVKLMEVEPSIPFLLNASEGATNGAKEANNIVREVYQYFDTKILRCIRVEDVNTLLNVNVRPIKGCHVYGRSDERLRDGLRAKPGSTVRNTAYSYSYRSARCSQEVFNAVFDKVPYMLASSSDYAVPQVVQYCLGEVTDKRQVSMEKMLFDSNGSILGKPWKTRIRAVAYISPDSFMEMKLNSGMYMFIPKNN